MDILIINPPLYIKKIKKIAPRFPPYIALSVAAALEKAGFAVKVYDAFLECAGMENIKDWIGSHKPDIIGIIPADYMRFSPIEVDIELIKLIKSNFPNVPIVIMGLRKEDFINALLKKAPEIDYVLLGDPEETMVELAQCINGKNDTKTIPGLIAKNSGGDFLTTSPPRVIDDLDRLSFPAWHLIDLNRYYFAPHRYKLSKAYPVITVRGCPWNRCIFCKEISIMTLPPYRSRSAKNVVSEIESVIKKYGASEIQFYDSNFNTDIDWLRDFKSEIERRNISFSWSCLSRVDRLSREAVEIMRSTGCWNVLFGIESSSQHLLDIVDKGITIGQVREAVQLCRDAGIQSTGSFLIGLPHEHPQDVINSAKFAVDIGLDYAQFFISKWHNHHEQFVSQGKLLTEWDYSQFDFRGPAFIPNGYRDLLHLKKMQRKAYVLFYGNPSVILRHFRRIKSLRELKRLFLAFLVLIKINLERELVF